MPGFVNHFLWKVCYDILPTKMNLYKKFVIQNSICHICTREEETTIHALLSCPTTSDVWGAKANSMRKWTNIAPSMWNIWKQMIDKLTFQELEINAITLRQLWSRRNLVEFKEKFESPGSAFQKAKVLMKNYQNAQKPKTSSPLHSYSNLRNHIRKWQPPGAN